MLFLVNQVHAPEHCTKDRGGLGTLYDAHAPVKVQRILGDFARHSVYYLLEAERLEDVQQFLDPGWMLCTSQVIPVSDEHDVR